MAPPASSSGGIYNVREDGIEFQPVPQELATPKNGKEFLERFRSNFDMNILDQSNENELVFELIGVDVSFANALRRILLSEVPTMAIERVYIWDNTSIIHDEVLAHRLGLIPIQVDARLFDDFPEGDDIDGEQAAATAEEEDLEDDVIRNDKATDRNTIVFRLAVTCDKNDAAKKTKGASMPSVDDDHDMPGQEWAHDAAEAYRKEAIETPNRPYTKHIYTKDLEWCPQGDQARRFPKGIRPVYEDILIAKLRSGQSIELEAHAQKGIGKNHAKFSPVATACYRLMPHIELVQDVYDDLAEELVNLYEPGVFELVATTKKDPAGTKKKAKVTNPYACTMSRNYMRNPQLAQAIQISRIPNHFIFSVESVGMMSPAVLVAEALRVLQGKCLHLTDLVNAKTMQE